MARKGLFVNYQWCTGCHSCELACQMGKELPADQFGIKVGQLGPWEYEPGKWEYEFLPAITDQCDLCAERLAKGKLPSCVQHCQANCLQILDVDKASELLVDTKKGLFMTA